MILIFGAEVTALSEAQERAAAPLVHITSRRGALLRGLFEEASSLNSLGRTNQVLNSTFKRSEPSGLR